MEHWYKELHSKMVANGYQGHTPKDKPKYAELAHLLNDMFDKMDRAFTKENL